MRARPLHLFSLRERTDLQTIVKMSPGSHATHMMACVVASLGVAVLRR